MLRALLTMVCLLPLGCAVSGAGSPARAGAQPVSLSDEQMLDIIQHRAFDFFWNETSSLGLTKDRAGAFAPDSYRYSSIASTGFALAAVCVGESRGWVSRDDARARVMTTLLTFRDKLTASSGFYYHFVDKDTGAPWPGSEISDIDTALFVYGAIFAGEYFQQRYADGAPAAVAQEIYQRVDWPSRLGGYQSYCEYIMMDLLAMGSPTHPCAPSLWQNISRPYRDNLATRPQQHAWPRFYCGPLFTHQYPQCYLDLRFRRDAYTQGISYFQSSRNSTLANRQFCLDHSADAGIATPRYTTYAAGRWGLTAGDGPDGYRAYGEADPAVPSSGDYDGTLLPHAAGGSVMFAPEVCIPLLRSLMDSDGEQIWGRYGFCDAFNVDRGWHAQDVIGIDLGAVLLSIENWRTGLPWRVFMRNAAIRRGLAQAGFVDEGRPFCDDFASGPPDAWGAAVDASAGGGVAYVPVASAGPWIAGRALRLTSSLPGGRVEVGLNGFDACYADQISFFIRGESGGERVSVGLRDVSGAEAQVDVGSCLPAGRLTTDWQAAIIPLSRFAGIRLTALQAVTFSFAAAPAAAVCDFLAFTGEHPDAEVVSAPGIGAAAELPDGLPVVVDGVAVTANFGSFLYVEQPDRSAGIRVDAGGPYVPGDALRVRGTVQTVGGERCISPLELTKTGRVPLPGALLMGTGTIGMPAPETVGLRVSCWGVAGDGGIGEFVLSGPSGEALQVWAPSLPPPSRGAFVVVTGVVGARSGSGGREPLLRVRLGSDIQTVQEPPEGIRTAGTAAKQMKEEEE